MVARKPLKTIFPAHLKPLQKTIVYQSREANEVVIDNTTNELSFAYLNRTDGFVLDVFAEQDDEIEKKLTPAERRPRLEGEVIGIDREPRYVDYDFGRGWVPGAGMLIASVAFLFLGYAISLGIEEKALTWNVRGVVAIILILISTIIGAALLVAGGSALLQPKIPRDLYKQGDKPDSIFQWVLS